VSGPQVITLRPAPEQYAWTFGGAPPVARVRAPAVLELFTEDCFAGRVRSETDLVCAHTRLRALAASYRGG